MSLDQSKVIDAIGIDTVSGAVRLTIIDDMEWGPDHLRLLQDKLNAYIAFVESGELVSTYPGTADRGGAIDLVLCHRPDAEVRQFLEAARPLLDQAGLGFHYGPLETGYVGDNSRLEAAWRHEPASKQDRTRPEWP
jgi:hypothetical protein